MEVIKKEVGRDGSDKRGCKVVLTRMVPGVNCRYNIPVKHKNKMN